MADTLRSESSLPHVCRIALILIVTASGALAGEIALEYKLDPPVISPFEFEGQSFHKVYMEDAPVTGNPGEPALPTLGVYVLLPYGTEFDGAEVTASNETLVTSGIRIEPCGYPMKLSESRSDPQIPVLDSQAYESTLPYPRSRYDVVGTQCFRGFNILVLKLYPIRFTGATGELRFASDLTVRVTAIPTAEIPSTYRGLTQDADLVRCIVDNPDLIATYPVSASTVKDGYDLLIITTDALAAGFLPLKEYHDTTGCATQIHTVDTDIGSADPADVRDYIREKYLSDGINYVLIGADDELIPAQDLYVLAWTTEEFAMPADFYFSCLDGTFDFDGDQLWGEPHDGEGGGDVDLMSEVSLGRACVFNQLELQRFVEKTIHYLESEKDPYLREVLFTGEYLGYPNMKRYGAYGLELLDDGSSDDGYTTVGFPSRVYDVEKLYDLLWPGGWPASEIVDRINEGRHIITHLGHSNASYSMKLYIEDLDQLENEDLCFIYNMGCFAGDFDGLGPDCWAEEVTVKRSAGAFAGIMNARYGWVEGFLDTDRADGPSLRFAREFWDALFNPDENLGSIGRAHSDSRHDNIWRINQGANRWVAYEITLFGDPTIELKKPASIVFSCPEGLPHVVSPGEPTPIHVHIVCTEGGTIVPGSEMLYYSVDGCDYQSLPLDPVDGTLYEAELPPLECSQSVEYYFSANELTYGQYSDCDQQNAHRTIIAEEMVTLFSDDFESESGWSATGGLWQRGVPTGQGGSHTSHDPVSGTVGPNVFGYNLSGDYENNLPEMHLTSPQLDCSEYQYVLLSFDRWLGVEQSEFDHASVRISTDGLTWDTVWSNASAIADGEWIETEYDISNWAANQSEVLLRWTMGATSDSMTYCGWNVDNVRVEAYRCQTYMCGDADGSWAIDIDDAVHLIGYIFSGGPAPEPTESGDCTCSGGVDIDDVVHLILYIFGAGNPPCDLDGDAVPDC